MAARAGAAETGDRDELELHLHAEIEKLADRHRRAIVLCDLEGLTHEQAAQLLGSPVGTIKSRLARGRELLRRRLSRRGLTVSGGAPNFAPADSDSGPAITGALLEQTARSAMQIAEGNAGAVPASVSYLVGRVMSSMFRSKLKTVAIVTLSAAGITIGIGWATIRPLAQAGSTTLVNSATQEPVRRSTEALVGHTGLVRSAAFLPGGRELISTAAPDDDLKRRARSASGMWRLLKAGGRPNSTATRLRWPSLPTGGQLAVAIARGEPQNRSMVVRVFSLRIWISRRSGRSPRASTSGRWPLHPTGNHSREASAGCDDDRFYGEVWFWDPASGKELRKLTGHTNPVMALAFSRDDATLASGSGAYGAPVGEVRRLLERRLGPARAVVFDPQRGHRRGLVFSETARRSRPAARAGARWEGPRGKDLSLGGGNGRDFSGAACFSLISPRRFLFARRRSAGDWRHRTERRRPGCLDGREDRGDSEDNLARQGRPACHRGKMPGFRAGWKDNCCRRRGRNALDPGG